MRERAIYIPLGILIYGDTERTLSNLTRSGKIGFSPLHILFKSSNIQPFKGRLITNLLNGTAIKEYMLFYILKVVINIIVRK
ncbi:hypothetical protein C922_05621 [Plasmodium inui San Antonio 1]|uniref:Uncharacterized protein n=1 Tax=Plasmodium inui San Antonio 1 TaxID=1237626 RepID=W7A4I1_9APIC|nr:hypothetical protein C922_05621 [Plasmodium inui San Antonio 1]EUD63999.1 hypothetical protein C922_05621 [Plasmodium inui San Antonio 1]